MPKQKLNIAVWRNGKMHVKEVEGKPIEIEGARFFVHQQASRWWIVYEYSTGMWVRDGDTQKGAIATSREELLKRSSSGVKDLVAVCTKGAPVLNS